TTVMDAWSAFEFVGLPEGEFFLAHACIYLATAPKSNAVKRAMGETKRILNEAATIEVPFHLRNAPIKGMADQGYGKGYQYAHNDARGIVSENYFPIGMEPRVIYDPSNHGFEEEVKKRLERTRGILSGHAVD
ncbi:replication-associated recombination protein A, partial [Candidatus Peregrinibacteria bacterium]|nr:replication-associated recombination protein A [Candidatus Peregrinibacteria bacterium]